MKSSKINFVDLAGSERVGKAGTQGKHFSESKNINLSLTTLGRVINAIINQEKHIPFRDSKLTLLLRESLGGNSKTAFLCTASRLRTHYEESRNSLNFAKRLKSIKNKASSNNRSPLEMEAMIQKLKDKAINLEDQLISTQVSPMQTQFKEEAIDPTTTTEYLELQNDFQFFKQQAEQEREAMAARAEQMADMEEELRMLRGKDAQSSSIAEMKQQMGHVQTEYDQLSDMYQKSLKQVLDLTNENNSLRSQLHELGHRFKAESFEVFLKIQKEINAKFVAKTLNEAMHAVARTEEHASAHKEIQEMIDRQAELISGMLEKVKAGEFFDLKPSQPEATEDPVRTAVLKEFAEKVQLIDEMTA